MSASASRIPPGAAVALVDVAVELAELHETDRTLKIGHAVVVAEFVEGGQQPGLRAVMTLLLLESDAPWLRRT